MIHIKRIAYILAFSFMLLAGCTSQYNSRNGNRQSTKRYHRSCGCFINQPAHADIALNTFVNGK